jgi:hypothetical protein
MQRKEAVSPIRATPTMRRSPRMTAPLHPSIPDSPPETLMILFRIISRRSWDQLQSWHKAIPESRIEHLMFGLYVLIIEPSGARGSAK